MLFFIWAAKYNTCMYVAFSCSEAPFMLYLPTVWWLMNIVTELIFQLTAPHRTRFLYILLGPNTNIQQTITGRECRVNSLQQASQVQVCDARKKYYKYPTVQQLIPHRYLGMLYSCVYFTLMFVNK